MTNVSESLKPIRRAFSWLHLSDLHVGMGEMEVAWPRVQHDVVRDLKRLVESYGPWDVVIFSGDLTQKGTKEEFLKLTEILKRLWANFAEWGFKPKLFVVPGNHDLQRPPNGDPTAVALKHWDSEPALQEGFWKEPLTGQRASVSGAFANFQEWEKSLDESGIPLLADNRGLLPGDVSARFSGGGLTIGLVGLNSTWRQLQGGDYEKRVTVDVRQLLSVTNGNADDWCSANDASLLVTHHPSDWLSEQSLKHWKSDIYPPERFVAHLFGHMHDPNTVVVAEAGSKPRRFLQAPSCFGLEAYGDEGEIKRIHGYSLCKLIFLEDQIERIQVWPRAHRVKKSGEGAIGSDGDFNLEEDNSYSIPILTAAISPLKAVQRTNVPVEIDLKLGGEDEAQEKLHLMRARLPQPQAHLQVRRVEVQKAVEALSESRAVWVVAEWGLGADEFISVVRAKLDEGESSIFRIDLGDYENRDAFLESMKLRLGCSFQQFCEYLSRESSSYLFLDGLPNSASFSVGSRRFASDIEDLAKSILDYCPQVKIVLSCRCYPSHDRFQPVELRPFDEADLLTYVVAHDKGGSNFKNSASIAKLYQYTEGVPERIDRALKDLEIVSIGELVGSESDFTSAPVKRNVSAALEKTIAELAESSDPHLTRSYLLLKSLSLFPQGEYLDRVKRIAGAIPFHPPHAHELIDRGLVDVVSASEVGSSSNDAKRLVVRRSVRDYLFSILGESNLRALNSQAVRLYFGEKWGSDEIKSPGSLRFHEPARGAADIDNGSALVRRLVHLAVNDGDRAMKKAVHLLGTFSAALVRGDHFRSVVLLLQDVIPLIPDSYSDQLSNLKYSYAKSLRMVGELTIAKTVLLELQDVERNLRKHVLVSLALTHESLREMDEALEVAKRVISEFKGSNQALQCESIIAEADPDEGERMAKLAKLERRARNNKAHVVANNIAISRARYYSSHNPEHAKQIIETVLDAEPGTNDHYNEVRASVEFAHLTLNGGRQLNDYSQARLINSYQYLYNERLDGLFSRCHSALWTQFERTGEVSNLLRLFRHSSFMWRLGGQEQKEIPYIKKLSNKLTGPSTASIASADKETAYFLSRTGFALSDRTAVEGIGRDTAE